MCVLEIKIVSICSILLILNVNHGQVFFLNWTLIVLIKKLILLLSIINRCSLRPTDLDLNIKVGLFFSLDEQCLVVSFWVGKLNKSNPTSSFVFFLSPQDSTA